MGSEQTARAPHLLRHDAVCFLSSRFPDYSGLPELIPDDLIAEFTACLMESPSATFLEYCKSAFATYTSLVAINRIRNLLSVLPDGDDSSSGLSTSHSLRRRSVSVSLTVWVVTDMEKNCLGRSAYLNWDKGVRYWVRSAVKLAHELPDLFHVQSSKDHLLNYMYLVQHLGRSEQLIAFCRERKSLEPSLVRTFLDNKAPALGEGSL